MGLIETEFSILNPGFSLAENLIQSGGISNPIIFSDPTTFPFTVFVVDGLESWNAGGQSQKSTNSTPYGQIKDLSYHVPSYINIEGWILKNPEFGGAEKSLRDAARALSLGGAVADLIANGTINPNTFSYDSYSQAMGAATTIADNNSPLNLWNFPAEFNFLFYSNINTYSVWTLEEYNFENNASRDNIDFRMKLVEQVVPFTGVADAIRRVVNSVLL